MRVWVPGCSTGEEAYSAAIVVSGTNILLGIRDDGKGFDVQQRLATLTKEKKLGLRSMQERINLLKVS